MLSEFFMIQMFCWLIVILYTYFDRVVNIWIIIILTIHKKTIARFCPQVWRTDAAHPNFLYTEHCLNQNLEKTENFLSQKTLVVPLISHSYYVCILKTPCVKWKLFNMETEGIFLFQILVIYIKQEISVEKCIINFRFIHSLSTYIPTSYVGIYIM